MHSSYSAVPFKLKALKLYKRKDLICFSFVNRRFSCWSDGSTVGNREQCLKSFLVSLLLFLS